MCYSNFKTDLVESFFYVQVILFSSLFCYNIFMEYINNLLGLFCHLLFIGISYQLLMSLFDWSKLVKNRAENLGKIQLFVFFIAIIMGYLVSHFILELIQMGQSLFLVFG
ncbi:DUF1146 family protein [Streptococcus parauberis]|nr:hypothetical protein SPSF3K_01002 [Streptococcus parauberis]KYP16724.1 hypothetical protein AKL14_01772 [Streptococcus parauberis]KYP18477.1 hypothetical protein AKL13_01922 [Streptococcus parauberis]KYP20686.1 hypothetical protein TN39_01048 [Streptococcus parauberis]KYP24474.1 hypothetical protein ADO04_00754 [Streptococcus parauberis]